MNTMFVHLNNGWQQDGFSTLVRKALITINPDNIIADPRARNVITVGKSLGKTIEEASIDWTQPGGAIERNKVALSKCTTVLIISHNVFAEVDGKIDRYAQNLLMQAKHVEATVTCYVLSPTGLAKVNMANIQPFPYKELDSTPFAVADVAPTLTVVQGGQQ